MRRNTGIYSAHKLVELWEKAQVELHGKYSTQRLREFTCYCEKTRFSQVVTLPLLAPLPCIAAVVLIDLAPLQSPAVGASSNYVFWLRLNIIATFTAFTLVDQCRHLVPAMKMTLRQVLNTAAITGIGTTAGIFGIAQIVGFPIPFTIVTCSPLLQVLAIGCTTYQSWHVLRTQTAISQDILRYFHVSTVLFVLTIVYPAYNAYFVTLSSRQQTLFAFLLPVIKLVAKNAVSHTYKLSEDLKPDAVILNVEVFHALFVSSSMQNSTSPYTPLVLMFVDFAQFWLSLREVVAITSVLEAIKAKSCVAIGDTTNVPESRLLLEAKLASTIKMAMFMSEQRLEQEENVTQPTEIVEIMNDANKCEFVALVLKLLHMVEHHILVEFAEVIVPVIYSIFLIVLFYLPNRAYYPHLRDVDADRLQQIVTNVLLYALLELVSLLVFEVILKRKSKISPTYQLGFVLDRQWWLVQAKLILWVLFTLDMALEHFGVDYSFQFAWLKNQTP